MALIESTAKKLLKEIVGGSNAFTTATRYLGLSSTKPTLSPDGVNYNITEPVGGNYSRVELNPGSTDFYFTNADIVGIDVNGDETEVIADIVGYKITNSREIHFPECIGDSWCDRNPIKYFVIFNNKTSMTPVYAGEIEKPEGGIIVETGNVPLIQEGKISVTVK